MRPGPRSTPQARQHVEAQRFPDSPEVLDRFRCDQRVAQFGSGGRVRISPTLGNQQVVQTPRRRRVSEHGAANTQK